jgi:hypothetical protein
MQSENVKGKIAAVAVAAAAGVFVPSAPAHANSIDVRCTDDSLDPATARLRLEWARDCGTRLNVRSPTTPVPPASSYDTLILAADGHTHLIEYLETDDSQGLNSFSGVDASVNGTYTNKQWRPGACSVTTDANGFQKWTEPTTLWLPRPGYPTFGSAPTPDPPTTAYFPNPNYAVHDCNLYLDKNATVRANTTAGFYVMGYCTSSCYTPEQEISFSTGSENILDALNAYRSDLTTLTPSSTLHDIQLQTDGVASYTRELRDVTQPIFEIRTQSGGELRVTPNHPVLEGNGRLVQASSLKVGQKLIKPDGSRDPIVSITKTEHFGKVYNLKPTSTNRVSNILIAQGFLVGSSRFQNDDVGYINRIILGRGLPKDVIPR